MDCTEYFSVQYSPVPVQYSTCTVQYCTSLCCTVPQSLSLCKAQICAIYNCLTKVSDFDCSEFGVQLRN
eukprot:5970233-Pyramimonas_sp.AAC.3